MRPYWSLAVCVFLLLAVGLVFGQTASHEFIAYDDNSFVYENPHVTSGLTLSGLWWAMTDGPLGEWGPLASLSHMLDCHIYGLNPAGHHLTSVLLHAASSVILFLVLLRMTGDLWPSAWVAAVFAVHPLHVESVAWVAERKDVLSGLFFMLTLGAYALYAEHRSLARYLAVAGCLALGLMAKLMLVTVPFVLLLLDYWPLGRFRGAAGTGSQVHRFTGSQVHRGSDTWLGRMPAGCQLVMEKLPLLALSAVSCGITLSTHATMQSDRHLEPLSFLTRLANALVSYAEYLGQSFYPIDMAVFYPHLGTRLPMAWAGGSFVLLVAITAAVAYCWRRRPYLPVGWLWFLGMLLPVLGFVGTFPNARADRYTYLSQIGLSIALAWGVWNVYQSRQSSHAASWRRWTLGVVSGGAVLTLAVVAWRQTTYWRNSETLWTHTISCPGQNLTARIMLAQVFIRQEKPEEAITQLREAVVASSIDPMTLAASHLYLAELLNEQGKVDEALSHYEQTVRLFPSGELGHTRFATALAAAGRHDQAIIQWRESIRLSPKLWAARIGLANDLLAIGDASEAAAQCREVLKIEPSAVEAIVILATVLADDGNVEQAIPHLRRALELDPRNARAHLQLGLALYDRGQPQSAVDHLNEAIRLQPDDGRMLWRVAWILATASDPSVRDGAQAVELARRAIQFSKGQEPRAFDALAAALAETGEFSAAIDAAEQASTLALLHNDDALADAIGQRTRLYRQGLPYRQSATLPAGQPPPKTAG